MTTPYAREAERQAMRLRMEYEHLRHGAPLGGLQGSLRSLPLVTQSQESLTTDCILDPGLLYSILWTDLGRAPQAPQFRPDGGMVPMLRAARLEEMRLSPLAGGVSGGFGTDLADSTFGKSNIAANAYAATEAYHHALETYKAKNAIQAALIKIVRGQAAQVHVNDYLEVVNINAIKSGAARAAGQIPGRRLATPQILLRFKNVPMNVLEASGPLGLKNTIGPLGRAASQSISRLSNYRWNNGIERGMGGVLGRRLGQFGTKAVSPILTFGPSAYFDLIDSFHSDANGHEGFDGRNFIRRSIKSQSGNLVGLGIGKIAMMGAVALGVASGGWVILIGLGFGILAQAVWNESGAADWCANQY